jgi:hypothetical protein
MLLDSAHEWLPSRAVTALVLADATGHKYINSGYLQGRSHLTYVRDCSQCVQMCVCMLCSGWVRAGHFGKGAENGGLRVFKELA